MRAVHTAPRVSGAQLTLPSEAAAPAFIDVTHDPSKVREAYARELARAVNQPSNKAHLVSFLKSTFGVSESDITGRGVRLRILWGTTVFGHSGRRLTAEERYGLQLEKRSASGAYVPMAPTFGAAVQWTRDANGYVNGFALQLSKT